MVCSAAGLYVIGTNRQRTCEAIKGNLVRRFSFPIL